MLQPTLGAGEFRFSETVSPVAPPGEDHEYHSRQSYVS